MKKIIYSTFIFFLFVTQVFAQDAMYIHLKNRVEKFLIADIDSVKFEETTVTHYNYFISKNASSGFIHYSTTIPTINAASDFNIVYNSTTPINLNDLVLATASNGVVEKTFAEYGLGTVGVNYQFVFSNSFAYTGMDGVTNQNSFISIQSDGSITIVGGTSAIDRTPVVKVELKSSAGTLLAQAYIKLKIVNSSTPPPANTTPVSYMQPAVTCTYTSLYRDAVPGVSAGDYMDINLTWIAMNGIYSSLGVSHNEFQAIFGALTPAVAVKVNDIAVPGATLSQYPLIRSILSPNIDTYAMKYQVSPLAKFGTTSVTYTFTPSNTAYPVLNITFTYTVTKPILDKSILSPYQFGSTTDIMTTGMSTGSGYKMQLYLGEAFGYGSSSLKSMFGTAAGKIDGATHHFAFKSTIPAQTGAQLTPATVTTIDAALGTSAAPRSGQLLDLTTKLTTAERVYAMQFITLYPNAETDIFDFNVHFINPLSIELDPAANFQLIDKINGTADNLDLKGNYIVKFRGRKIVTKGVAETANTATTLAASDYVDITNAAYGLFYQLTPGNNYSTISKAGGNAFSKQSVITWNNAGAALILQQNVATTQVKFVSSFAEVIRVPDNVTVIPE